VLLHLGRRRGFRSHGCLSGAHRLGRLRSIRGEGGVEDDLPRPVY
jgi:hypothetical protein